MQLIRKAALLLVSGMMLLAPLACLRFCQLQSILAQRQSSAWLAEIARLHALNLDEREAQQPHQQDDCHHAPLSRIRHLVLSVTEFLLVEGGLFQVVVVLLWMVTLSLRLVQPPLCVPKPPPRPLACAL